AFQNPLDESLDVLVRDMPLRRHRNGAPRALAAVLDLGDQFRFGVCLTLILLSNLIVPGADYLVRHAMAGHAALLVGQRQRRRGGRLLAVTGRLALRTGLLAARLTHRAVLLG